MKNSQANTVIFALIALASLLCPVAAMPQASPKHPSGATIRGRVLGLDGRSVSGATVSLAEKGSQDVATTETKADGTFAFSSLAMGAYRLSAEKTGLRSHIADVSTSSANDLETVDLVLQKAETGSGSGASSASGAQAMQFSDQPNFTIAGVTDWTAVGGHGSDSTLRTSESLAGATLTLKPETKGHDMSRADGDDDKQFEMKLRAALASTPDNFDANHRLGSLYLRTARYQEAIPLLEKAYQIDPVNKANQYDLASAYEGSGDLAKAKQRIGELLAKNDSADLHRVMGELDEKSGDPLSAVHEYVRAVELNPSEQNYFAWGSELLLHRAVWQALEIFQKGAAAYPKSARMQMALGTTLFAGARYEEAAHHLCQASDLNPTDPNPYLFMGKIQMAAPDPLACIGPKLARFVEQDRGSSDANYLYAMYLLKSQERMPDQRVVQHAEALLTKAVTIDSKCSEGYLQLGILSASRRDFDKAIALYTKAIEANPQLADAYYRLGVAYDRTGQPAKAKQEFELHDQIKQRQAEATEQQRREVKQFLVVQPEGPVIPTSSH